MTQAISLVVGLHFKRAIQQFRYNSAQSSSYLFHPVLFWRNHIKPFVLARTQWSNRLVTLILLARGLVHECGNPTYVIQIGGCGGSGRSTPYRVQNQIPLNQPTLDSFIICSALICARIFWYTNFLFFQQRDRKDIFRIRHQTLIFIDSPRGLCQDGVDCQYKLLGVTIRTKTPDIGIMVIETDRVSRKSTVS